MSNVYVPQVKISVTVEGVEVARVCFDKVDRAPAEWEVSAAIVDPDARTAVRACLLAAVSEISSEGWTSYSFIPEGGGETNDQPQLPWE